MSKIKPEDDVRPRGTVEVQCVMCGWSFWVDCLDPKLPEGPFVCVICENGPGPVPKGGVNEDP